MAKFKKSEHKIFGAGCRRSGTVSVRVRPPVEVIQVRVVHVNTCPRSLFREFLILLPVSQFRLMLFRITSVLSLANLHAVIAVDHVFASLEVGYRCMGLLSR